MSEEYKTIFGLIYKNIDEHKSNMKDSIKKLNCDEEYYRIIKDIEIDVINIWSKEIIK